MCGIAGHLSFHDNASLRPVRAMCRRMIHRGPDDEGFYKDGPLAMGMRRLSIIDLAHGHQPLANEDDSVWVVFNGEIYNFAELRQDLSAQGHRFKTLTDTEVLVHLYEQEGPSGLSRLRGMFAFAIWDTRERCLLLARDRFGKKPLYLGHTTQGFYFASEMKCLQALDDLPLDLDDEALRLYFLFSYIPEPWTLFRGIRKLAPGSWLKVSSEGQVKQGRYWTPPISGEAVPEGLSRESAQERLRSLLDESVRLRMVADVPVGAFLSGGLDSSAVVASMTRHKLEPVKTFSIGFEEADYSELPYALLLAQHCHTDHHELIVPPDAMNLIERVLAHLDEPLGDTAALPTYLLAQFAAQHVKVALSGDGGDEIFAGYESFSNLARWAWADGIPDPAKSALNRLAELLPDSAYGKNLLRALSRKSPLDRYFEMNTMPYLMRRSLFQSHWMLPGDAAYLGQTLAHHLPAPPVSTVSQALYFESSAKLSGNMLVKLDRMSMAHSLEVRCPLLDGDLAAFAGTLPNAWKLRKKIFVESMTGRLPNQILNRRKMGFTFPLASWFRTSLRTFLRDSLLDARFLRREIVSQSFLEHLLDEHERRRRNNSHWLYMLLVAAIWFQHVDDLRSPASAAATSDRFA